MENSLLWILVVAGIVVGLVIGLVVAPNGLSQEDIDKAVTDATSDLNKQLANKSVEVSNLTSKVNQLENQIDVINKSTESSSGTEVEGYLIDELELDNAFNETLSDREVEKLVDSKVEFKDKDYDYEEIVYLDNLKVAINEKDFKENAYLSVLEDGIKYEVVFENSLNTSKIDEDDTLKFKFLGQDVEVVEWDNNKITLLFGDEIMVDESQSIQVDGKNVNIMGIYEERVYISVDGDGKSLKEGDSVTLNDVEIKVKEILYSSKDSQVSKVVLVVGSKVEEEIESGDEYEEDSIWEYVITEHSVGLVLKEDFKDLDEDEDYNVLDVDEQICLPNDYVCVKYNGLSDEDVETYSFDLKNDTLVRIKGKFQAGLNDYDKIYYNSIDGKFYEDDDAEDVISEAIMLGDSDLELANRSSGDLRIIIPSSDNVVISKNLDWIKANNYAGNNITQEDNYRTAYGIVIDEPENSVEDREITLKVPMDKLEASVSVI